MLWAVFAPAAVGLIAAGSSVIALIGDNRVDDRLIAASPPATTATQSPQQPTRPAATIRPHAIAASAINTDESTVAAAGAGKINTVAPAGRPATGSGETKVKVDSGSCEDDTWANLDGTCVAGQIRKVRQVRTPTTRSDPPAVAKQGKAGGTPGQAAASPAVSSSAAQQASQSAASAKISPRAVHSRAYARDQYRGEAAWREGRGDSFGRRNSGSSMQQASPLAGFFSFFR